MKIYLQFVNYWNHKCSVNINENGTKTAVLFGNSFASRFSYTAVEALKGTSIRKLYVYSRATCAMFDTLNKIEGEMWHCNESIGRHIAVVKKIKPDIIINVSRLIFC